MRWVGVLLALAVLAAGLVLGQRLESDAASQNEKSARELSEKSAEQAATALERQLALFQVKAQGAANNQTLRALVSAGTNEATIHDAFTNENWTSTYRDRGGALAVFAGDRNLGGSPSMVGDDVLAPLAHLAQTDSEASRYVAHQGIFLAAAARLPIDLNGAAVAIVLTRPLGQDELDALSTRPLIVTDGKTRLGARGEVTALSAVVGREAEGPVVLSAGVASPRATKSLWVWSLQPIGAVAAPALSKPAVWGASAAAALAVLAASLLAGRKKAGPSADQAVTDTGLHPPPARGPAPSQAGAFAATSPSTAVPSRYIEVAPLGEGGMAKVSLAVTHGAEGFRRHFVVKRLKVELTTNPELVNQFIDEARLGASLVHSNVVPVFDFGRDAEGYFIAQEYIMGRDLDAVRRSLFELHRATLNLPLVLYVAQEALKALAYAHGKTDDSGRPMGLVHRDVSPNNLMVSARGELKLLDFGIMKAEGKLSQTATGVIKGNVFYMSPEQARGLPVDNESDLFSLGLVLFTAAAGETLYRGTSNYELLTRAGEGLSAAEWARIARLPSVLAELLQRALQFDPNKRYSSADEFAANLPQAQIGSSGAMQQLMDALFKDEFARERSRFSSPNATGVGR